MVQGAITIDICKDPNDLTYVFDNLVFVCLIKGLGLLAKRFAHIMPTYYLGQNSLPLHHECLADDSVKMLQKDLYVLQLEKIDNEHKQIKIAHVILRTLFKLQYYLKSLEFLSKFNKITESSANL